MTLFSTVDQKRKLLEIFSQNFSDCVVTRGMLITELPPVSSLLTHTLLISSPSELLLSELSTVSDFGMKHRAW